MQNPYIQILKVITFDSFISFSIIMEIESWI